MNVALPDGNVVAIPDGVSQKDINDILNTYTNNQLVASHGETPPASTVPYNEGLLKRGVRGALKVVGGAGAGILATPETFGAGTIPAAMLGYSVGKKAGDVILGPEPPTAPPAPRQATSMLGSMAEGVTRLPESLPRTAEGLMTFPAQAIESLTTPAAQGDIKGVGLAAWENVKGLGEFLLAPTGALGLEKAKDVWAQDFAGSALGFTGAAKMAPGAARGATRAGKAAYRAAENRVPYTQRNTEMAAGNALTGGDIRGGGYIGNPLDAPKAPEAAIREITESPVYKGKQAENAAQTGELLKRIGTPEKYRPTYAQETGDLPAAFFEQSVAAKSKDVGARLMENDSVAMSAALKNMAESVGPGEGPIAAPYRAKIGSDIIDAIDRAKKPVQDTMSYLEDQIPDYGMKAKNLAEKVSELGKESGMADQGRAAVADVSEIMTRRAPGGNTTTLELRGVKRTLGQKWKDAKKAGDNEAAFVYNEAIKAIEADYADFSGKVATDKTAFYKGQEVSISALTSEYQKNLERMAELQKNLEPDYMKMRQELHDAKVPPREWMSDEPGMQGKLKGQQKALDAYKRFMGKDPPVAAASDGVRGIESYANRNKQISQIIAEAAPGADAGAAMKAFNDYAKREWFGKFDKGAVKDVTSFGGEASGLRTEHEKIGGKLWGDTNAKDLVRAIGQEKAGEVMAPHALAEIAKASVDQNGVMNVHAATKWIKDNKGTLDQYGLTERAKNIVRGQLRSFIENETAKMNVDKLGTPQMGPMGARKFVDKMTPTLRQLGYDAKTVQTFQDYHATVQMLARNKNVTFSGNSTTVEKLFGDDTLSGPGGKLVRNLTNVIIPASGFTAGHMAGGTGAGIAGLMAAQAAKGFLEAKHAESRTVFKQILVDAMFDPQLAGDLMTLARTAKNSAIGKRIGEYAKQVFSDIRSGAQKLKDDQRGMVGRDIGNQKADSLPIAGETVDGRRVLKNVPNTDSIRASMENYSVLKGIREVNISDMDPVYVSDIKNKQVDARTKKLMDAINNNKQIAPLIIAYDSQGPYVLEGGHRYDALIKMGAKSFPALVVVEGK